MEESGVSLIPCRKKEKRKKALSSPPILTELLINGPLQRRPMARSNPQKRDKTLRNEEETDNPLQVQSYNTAGGGKGAAEGSQRGKMILLIISLIKYERDSEI